MKHLNEGKCVGDGCDVAFGYACSVPALKFACVCV